MRQRFSISRPANNQPAPSNRAARHVTIESMWKLMGIPWPGVSSDRHSIKRVLAVGELVLRSCHRRLGKSAITHAGLAAVFGQLLVMNREHDLEVDQDRLCH